jgi:hypothetical protein
MRMRPSTGLLAGGGTASRPAQGLMDVKVGPSRASTQTQVVRRQPAGDPRQILVLPAPAAAIPLVHTDRDELLTAGRTCPRRVRVDAASGVVHLPVLGAPAAIPGGHAGPAPRLKTVAMTAIRPEGFSQLDFATVRAALQGAALSLDRRSAPRRAYCPQSDASAGREGSYQVAAPRSPPGQVRSRWIYLSQISAALGPSIGVRVRLVGGR